VKVDFPVLLDRDGQLARKWKVISYPSTFIIDPEGMIRFGVNAAIDWDDPEVIEKLRSLFP
jgi:alkyl hydroperoxide reductase subunit AhpC